MACITEHGDSDLDAGDVADADHVCLIIPGRHLPRMHP